MNHVSHRLAPGFAAALTLAFGSMSVDAQEGGTAPLTVREVRGSPDSRRIPIRYILLPATGQKSAPPLIVVEGGPGVPGTSLEMRFARDSVLRRSRDIVLFDQRGTGGSNRLSCDAAGPLERVRDTLFPAAYMRRCRDSLSLRADLAAYTTEASTHDIDALREHIGAHVVDIFAISYGTKLAQSYIAAYPTRVRRVTLDGIVPPDTRISLEAALHIENAAVRAIGMCEESPACAARYPGLGSQWAKLHSSLPPGSGMRWRLAYALRGALYTDASVIPALITGASAGDFSSVDSVYAVRAAWVGNQTGTGLHLSVNCGEDIAHVSADEAARHGARTLMGDMYYSQYRAACDEWDVSKSRPASPMLPDAAIPALLLSGEYDPVTPPEFGDRVIPRFPESRHIVFKRGGHATPSKCKSNIAAQFHDGDPLSKLDVSCAGTTSR